LTHGRRLAKGLTDLEIPHRSSKQTEFLAQGSRTCTGSDCSTFKSMQLLLQVWGIETRPKREGKRLNFDAPFGENWTIARRDRFKELVQWPEGH
jgi:hypothetical protein